jgi:hypothetical protein
MAARERRLDWRSGGWLLLLAAALVVAIVAWRVVPILRTSSRAIGDGQQVESYGFSLDPLLVARERIVAAGFAKDGIPALVDPPRMRGDAVAAFNESMRGKYVVSDDRVVGLVLAGEARAYPVRLLNWHEIVNDTLGGVPVAVTYHPLCDSVVVFDRRVAGETLEFAVSGLLHNSNLLMFDRRAEARRESLWSQLLARAVAGPAAREGRVLRVLPASLARWDLWLEAHPDTTVIAPDPKLVKRYERNPYGNYYLTAKLRFPVDPLPPDDGRSKMRPIVVVERDGRRWLGDLDPQRPAEDGWQEPLAGVRLRIDRSAPPSVLIEPGEGTRVFYSAWFAWYAHYPSERSTP